MEMPAVKRREFGGARFFCEERGLAFGRIVAGLAWPSESNAGCCVVMGEEPRPILGTNTFPCHWLWEVEEYDTSAFLDRCVELQNRLCVETFYGRHTDMTTQILQLWNRSARDRRAREFHLSTVPFAEPTGRLQYHLVLLKDRIKKGQESVFLDKASKVPAYLDEILPEDTPIITDASHPHVGALAYAVTALTNTQPDVDDYSVPPDDDYNPLSYMTKDNYQ